MHLHLAYQQYLLTSAVFSSNKACGIPPFPYVPGPRYLTLVKNKEVTKYYSILVLEFTTQANYQEGYISFRWMTKK